MPRLTAHLLACVLAVAMASCSSSDESLKPEPLKWGAYEMDLEGTPEDLFFEALRLHSLGLLSEARMHALQTSLGVVEDRYSRDPAYEELLRKAIVSHLKLASREVRREDALALEGHEGRAYAHRLNRAGVSASSHYAEGMVLIAGMLGVPSSGDDALLMVAIPAGGYLLVKGGGMALKRMAFLLRRCKSADEVVRDASNIGLKVQSIPNASSLRTALVQENEALAEHFDELLAQVPRTGEPAHSAPRTKPLTSMRDVEVRSQAPASSELWSIRRGATAYASADVLRSRLKTFITEQVRPEFDEPFEFFLHGTTHTRAAGFEPEEGRRLFTATDIQVARLFAQRSVGREGGKPCIVVIAMPRELANQLRKQGVLRTQAVPDMPDLLETIFEPGAIEALRKQALLKDLPEGFLTP